MRKKESQLFTPTEWTRFVDHLDLSPRPAEVLREVVEGHDDRAIAESVGIGVSTVRTYLSALFTTFGVTNRTQLVSTIFREFRKMERSPSKS